jgi:serine/threonine-protein kinase
MAVVYEAESVSDGRRVALKMMSHRLTHDYEAQTRFQREGDICRSLEHPNILRTYDCFTSFATNFLVMEYCNGVSLADVIQHHGPLAESSVRKILGQLAAALNYAHARGICHRDLKPSNLLIDRQGTLKLADFGLARFLSSDGMTLEGRVLGTPQYMAPEQLTGKKADQRTDIFATGCIVWEMLTGQPLFSKADYFEILSFHQEWTLPPADEIVPGLSQELHDVLKQSLARKPAERTLDLGKIRHWADAADPALVEG